MPPSSIKFTAIDVAHITKLKDILNTDKTNKVIATSLMISDHILSAMVAGKCVTIDGIGIVIPGVS